MRHPRSSDRGKIHNDPHNTGFLMILAAMLALLMMCMGGCSASYHLERSKHHLDKAVAKGAHVDVIRDTIMKEVIIPGKDAEFILVPIETPVEVIKEKIKLVHQKGPGDTVFVDVICPPDTVWVPHVIEKQGISTPCGYKSFIKQWLGIGNFWFYVIHTLLGAGVLLGIYLKIILPKFPNLKL